ncbi:MAG TPA: LemA family protein [Methanomassiliicoccales archaeon]|nr:LemA family protein [Methanomassiliicoccales archaeon]
MAELRLSKGLIAGIIAAVAVLIVVMMIILAYNDMIAKEQEVENGWGNIEARYQRRIELIPAVSAAANASLLFEQNLLTNITNARTNWLNSRGDPAANVNATEELDRNMLLFVATYENYPVLQSIEVMRDFIAELSSTQGMIDAARIFYNDAVREYNTAIRSFPNVLFAGAFGFQEAVYYSQGM